MIDITIKIGGEAGFGIMTTGLFLGKIATRSGYHAFEYSEYPSLIRGGHNAVEVRISDEEVYSQEKKADILVCLNSETLKLHASKLKAKGMVVIDQEKAQERKIDIKDNDFSIVNVPFVKMLTEAKLNTVMVNNIALGVLVHLLGADFSILEKLISENFAAKGEEVVSKNIQAARRGFSYVKEKYPHGFPQKLPKKKKITPKMYLSGNEMIGLGSIAAGCKLFAAYPMTPTSNLLHYLASKQEASGIVVKHAEDEISAVNMAIGASWAGVRSMTGTSGGGFALMVESVALAGITETPLVIVMGQRPGPATGMPTWTEQGDLLFITFSGHGEFPKIVLAPGDLKEAYRMTIEAFNLADIYQTPVIVIADKYLLEGRQSVDKFSIFNPSADGQFSINRGKLLNQAELDKIQNYKRYLVTGDGISPRAIPGMKNSLHQVNSYEHGEDGHTTEDALERIKQVNKRNKKTESFLDDDFEMPQLYGDRNTPLTVISWGSNKGPILQAMRDNTDKFNYLHFSYLWPLPQDELTELLGGLKTVLLIENNSTAQFGKLLKMVTGIEIKNKLLKYSGRPIYPEEVLKMVDQLRG